MKLHSIAAAVGLSLLIPLSIQPAHALPKGKPFQELKAQIDANTALIEANAAEIVNLNDSVASINSRIETINTQISELETRVMANSDGISAAMERIQVAEGDIQQLRSDLSAMATQHAEDIGNINAVLQETALKIAELHNLRLALAASLNAQLADLAAKVESNTTDINAIVIDLLSVNAQLTSIISSIQDLETRHESLVSAFDLTNQALALLQDRVTDLEAVTDTLASYHLFTFSGIRNDLPISSLNGWSECYRKGYDALDAHPENMMSLCSGAKIMLACQATGSDTLKVAAYANREDVFFNTGDGGNTVHNANGVDWYFSLNYSMGFAPEGEGVMRNSADVQGIWSGSGDNSKRLSWHTHDSYTGGWRCGETASLNGSTAWQKVIYQAD